MLFPRHPQPARRGRETADMIVQQAQRAMLQPGHVLAVAPPPIDVQSIAGVMPGAASDDRLDFEVRYRLGEYLDVVREFARRELSTRQQALGKLPMKTLPPWIRHSITAIATPIFAFKKLRMPRCQFSIDAENITRRTRRSTVCEPWDAVAAVDRYAGGYLVRFAWGAMPLPLRALTNGQRATFERILAHRMVNVPPGPCPG